MDFRSQVDSQVYGARTTAIIQKDDKMLFIKDEEHQLYYTVGGAILVNETSDQAVLREIKEELGVEAEVGPLLWVAENMFQQGNRQVHTVEFHYLVRLKDEAPAFSDEEGEHRSMEWISVTEIDHYDIRPAFLKEELKNVSPPNTIRHIQYSNLDRKG